MRIRPTLLVLFTALLVLSCSKSFDYRITGKVESLPQVKKLFLIGVTKEKIAECCKKHGFMDFEFCDSFEEAIDKSYEAAEDGDCVLLSPACASWDMFKSYEQRGEIFKEYVQGLKE